MGSSFSPDQDISVRFLADLSGLNAGFTAAAQTVRTGVANMASGTGSLVGLAGATERVGTRAVVAGEHALGASRHLKTLAIEAASLGLGLERTSLKIVRFGSGLAALGIGGTTLFAAIGGISLMVAAYNKLTSAARAAREENDQLLDSLRKAREQASGAKAFDLAEAAAASVAALDEQIAKSQETIARWPVGFNTAFLAQVKAGLEQLKAARTAAQADLEYATSQLRTMGPDRAEFLKAQKAYVEKLAAAEKDRVQVLVTLAGAGRMTSAILTELRAKEAALQAEMDNVNTTAARSAAIVPILKDIRDALAPVDTLAARIALNFREMSKLSIIKPGPLPGQLGGSSLGGLPGAPQTPATVGIPKDPRQILGRTDQEWKAAFLPMKEGWDNALRSMLQGGHLFQNALKNIFAGVDQFFGDLLTSMVDKWLSGHAKMLAISIAHGIKDIAVKAAQAAASAWAALAGIPVVGPILAPLAAATALAGVLALGHNISSAEGGWGTVPFDQAALVHKNEMVLPAALADKVRGMTDGGGGGGDHYTINIHAQDAASFRDFLGRHDSTLLTHLSQAARDGRLG